MTTVSPVPSLAELQAEARAGGMREVLSVCGEIADDLNEAAQRLRWQVAMHGHLLSDEDSAFLMATSNTAEALDAAIRERVSQMGRGRLPAAA